MFFIDRWNNNIKEELYLPNAFIITLKQLDRPWQIDYFPAMIFYISNILEHPLYLDWDSPERNLFSKKLIED